MQGQEPDTLERFVDAQARVWERVSAELRAGHKTSHWMWFVFPQLRGLGHSPMAQCFGLSGQAEARAFLAHPVLGKRLRWAVEVLIAYAPTRTAPQMLGTIDAIKLRSCLTLFASLGVDELFDAALAALFGGERDMKTLALIGS